MQRSGQVCGTWCIVEPVIFGESARMNKSELIDLLASRTSVSKADAQRVVDGFQEVVTQALSRGEDVALVGFGTFSVGERAERAGRNPRTGQTLVIPAAKVPKFSAGAKLKAAVNGGVEEAEDAHVE